MVAVAMLLGVVGWMIIQDPKGNAMFSVTSEEATELLAADSTLTVLDVRTEQEFRSGTGRLKGAILLPVQELSGRVDELEEYKDRPILVYCRTDNRSRAATSFLRDAGFDARFMIGGITRWNSLGLPVEKEGSP